MEDELCRHATKEEGRHDFTLRVVEVDGDGALDVGLLLPAGAQLHLFARWMHVLLHGLDVHPSRRRACALARRVVRGHLGNCGCSQFAPVGPARGKRPKPAFLSAWMRGLLLHQSGQAEDATQGTKHAGFCMPDASQVRRKQPNTP